MGGVDGDRRRQHLRRGERRVADRGHLVDVVGAQRGGVEADVVDRRVVEVHPPVAVPAAADARQAARGARRHVVDGVDERAVDVQRGRLRGRVVHAREVVPAVGRRREARLRVDEEAVGDGERELLRVAAQLQEERALEVAVLAEEGLVAVQVLQLHPGGHRVAFGGVDHGAGRDLRPAARPAADREAGKADRVRADDAGLPAGRAARREHHVVVADAVVGGGAGALLGADVGHRRGLRLRARGRDQQRARRQRQSGNEARSHRDVS